MKFCGRSIRLRRIAGMSCQEACTISAYYFLWMCGTVGSGGIARRRVQDSQCAARDQIASCAAAETPWRRQTSSVLAPASSRSTR